MNIEDSTEWVESFRQIVKVFFGLLMKVISPGEAIFTCLLIYISNNNDYNHVNYFRHFRPDVAEWFLHSGSFSNDEASCSRSTLNWFLTSPVRCVSVEQAAAACVSGWASTRTGPGPDRVHDATPMPAHTGMGYQRLRYLLLLCGWISPVVVDERSTTARISVIPPRLILTFFCVFFCLIVYIYMLKWFDYFDDFRSEFSLRKICLEKKKNLKLTDKKMNDCAPC